MPRTARASRGGICYHVMNRGNARSTVFHGDHDYGLFESLMHQATRRVPMRVLAWCLMPNHFHLVLWPSRDRDLSRWMHWLSTAHVQRHRSRHKSSGHIWQGRFKAPPIQQDHHLLTVMRYVERNPLRAGMVDRAEAWRWSSLPGRLRNTEPAAECPVSLPRDWVELVNQPLTAAELSAVRESLRRGRPYGEPSWVQAAAHRFDLTDTLRPAGRPRAFPGDPLQEL